MNYHTKELCTCGHYRGLHRGTDNTWGCTVDYQSSNPESSHIKQFCRCDLFTPVASLGVSEQGGVVSQGAGQSGGVVHGRSGQGIDWSTAEPAHHPSRVLEGGGEGDDRSGGGGEVNEHEPQTQQADGVERYVEVSVKEHIIRLFVDQDTLRITFGDGIDVDIACRTSAP